MIGLTHYIYNDLSHDMAAAAVTVFQGQECAEAQRDE